MLSVTFSIVMLSVAFYYYYTESISVVILNVVILNVVILNVVMLNVEVPV